MDMKELTEKLQRVEDLEKVHGAYSVSFHTDDGTILPVEDVIDDVIEMLELFNEVYENPDSPNIYHATTAHG